jgi:hypothetical protein
MRILQIYGNLPRFQNRTGDNAIIVTYILDFHINEGHSTWAKPFDGSHKTDSQPKKCEDFRKTLIKILYNILLYHLEIY